MRKNIGKILLIVLVCVLVIGCSLQYMYTSTDMYFMISTGREILKNGFEKTNPFVIDTGLGFVVQQWAYCVLIAFFDSLGGLGMIIFELLNVAVLIASASMFLSLFDISGYIRFSVSSLLYCTTAWFIGALRPEMITLSLLLIECYAFEKFRLTEKPVWLSFLPITMLLESNLHSSVIWFHFAIVLAYMVPSVCKSIKDTSVFDHLKYPILFSGLMAVCMFMNPYGADAVFYMINSLRGGIMDSSFYVITELQSGLLIVESLVCLIIVLFGLVFLCIFHKITSVCFYLTLGFSFCIIVSMRNCMYLYIVFLYMLLPLLTENSKKIQRETDRLLAQKRMWVALASGILLLVMMVFITGADIFNAMTKDDYLKNEVTDAVQYIKTNSGDTMISIFGPMEYCSVMEYYGLTDLLYDSRPELYTKAVNGKKDIMKELDTLVETANSTDSESMQEEIQNWIDSYKFTYIMIPMKNNMHLYSTYWNGLYRFCISSTEYKEVMNNQSVLLFKRTSNNR